MASASPGHTRRTIPRPAAKQLQRRGRTPHVIEETLVATAILQEAVQAIVRQTRVDRRHDVPYLAGSSRDGRTVYIDRHLPRTVAVGRRRLHVDPFIVLHETIEKLLFERYRLTYPQAHQVALRIEQVAVRNQGIPWRIYNRLMQAHIKQAHDERLQLLPKDLELKPYTDEHERSLLREHLARARRGRTRAS